MQKPGLACVGLASPTERGKSGAPWPKIAENPHNLQNSSSEHGRFDHGVGILTMNDAYNLCETNTIAFYKFDLLMGDCRFKVGSTIWAKGTVVTNESELHRRYGTLASKTYLPGLVTEGYIKPSSKGRQMKYVKATFYYGGNAMKTADVALSSTRTAPPDLANVPNDLAEFIKAGGVAPTVENEQPQSILTQAASTAVPMGQPTPSDSTTNTNYTNLQRMLDRESEREARRVSTEAPPPPVVNATPTNDITVTCHGTEWTYDKDSINCDTNGRVPDTPWHMKDRVRQRHG